MYNLKLRNLHNLQPKQANYVHLSILYNEIFLLRKKMEFSIKAVSSVIPLLTMRKA